MSSRQVRCVLAGALVLVTASFGVEAAKRQQQAKPAGPSASSTAIFNWIARENSFMRRYLAVVRQASHDYRYDYATPTLLMPIAMDLFTGYVARIHAIEEEALYPAFRAHMDDERVKLLELMVHDQHSESKTVKAWQSKLAALKPGAKLTDVAERIDYLGQLLNRHLVFQENQLVPLIEQLTPQEQAAVLTQIAEAERRAFGRSEQQRYEQLLAYMELAIRDFGGRVW